LSQIRATSGDARDRRSDALHDTHRRLDALDRHAERTSGATPIAAIAAQNLEDAVLVGRQAGVGIAFLGPFTPDDDAAHV